MAASDDRRLSEQERYLKGVRLYLRDYEPSTPRSDHNLCEFCNSKFSREGGRGSLNSGYTTADGTRWICRRCFGEFVHRFQWRLGATPDY